MKRRTKRDWGPLLTAHDGKVREPLSGRSSRRIPLSEALARDQAADLIRSIVPELADGPLYVVQSDAGGLPSQYRNGFVGLHSPWLDVALSSWLRDRGEWRGRGPAVVVNAPSLRYDAERDAGTDQAFADELFQGRLTAVLVHELAHVVEGPIDRREFPELAAASRQATEAVRRWSADNTPPAVPWQGHGGDWLRLLAHVHHRAERLLDRRLPTPWVCGDNYQLAPYLAYRTALADEPERLRGQTFETIRNTAPPEAFVDLWRNDVRRWFSSFTEPTAETTKAVVQGLRLFC